MPILFLCLFFIFTLFLKLRCISASTFLNCLFLRLEKCVCIDVCEYSHGIMSSLIVSLNSCSDQSCLLPLQPAMKQRTTSDSNEVYRSAKVGIEGIRDSLHVASATAKLQYLSNEAQI